MITTIQSHILDQHLQSDDASGTFSWTLSGITLATKMIAAEIRKAGLNDVYGAAGATNVQGEAQQKLDVFANEAMLHCLGLRDSVAALISEENDEPVIFEQHENGKYIIVFDPLDGSSNIDVNVNVGTIFSIFRKPDGASVESVLLQTGANQVAAGYVLYGPSTVFVYTTGSGVFGFTLDPAIGAYVLSFDSMKMPEQGSYYSVNEANYETFPATYQQYLTELRTGQMGRTYSSRYIGSLVADFHRTLLKGGIFLYPPTDKQPKGKLRLLYEANPLALIAEQAGGRATTGHGRVLDVVPTNIHERTSLIVGSRLEVERLERILGI
ncbi:MAG TPA: class 1 fructose-bisphosphatase [Acidobacteriaceae bacterium]